MFHNMPADEWLETEGPRIIELCRKNNVLYIASVGAADKEQEWVDLCRDMESIGADMVELDTRRPARHLRRGAGGSRSAARPWL